MKILKITKTMLLLECLVLFTVLTAAATDKPPIPTDFHTMVHSTCDGFCPYPVFSEVYQDVTHNRALMKGSNFAIATVRSASTSKS